MIPIYEVPNNTMIDISHLGFVLAETEEPINEVLFDHMDGMYAYCTFRGAVVHISCMANVKIC